QVNYDLLFIDNDYTTDDDILTYASSQEQLVLITKSFYMKKIDSLGIDIFKVLYEPLNSSKIRITLDAYDAEAFSNRKVKVSRRKKFDEKNSRFAATALVAEDNIINQKLIRRTLEDLGLEITIANNGLEAFEKRKNGNFDIIFMDIQMPVLDGIEATQEILDFEEDYNHNHIPIVALTANALKGDRERFMAAGMDEYTTKPLVRSEIISLLNNFLSHKIIEINPVPKSVHEIVASSEESASLPINGDALVEQKSETIIPEIPEESLIALPEEESINTLMEANEEDPILPKPEEESAIIDEPMIQERVSAYEADILIAKQNILELKLFTRILDDLGYTYKSVTTSDQLKEEISNHRYKLALFDKKLSGLNLKDLYDIIRSNSSDTSLVMLIDPSVPEESEDAMYVHEIIKNIINKDLLRLVFEKFI
ncbi:MAG: response regulator, partial [Sulfuricurvum sp.]|uniref:response regulator n=1 Tax=Sulfuricurvum sp. TaxID=2025608 RepID=UPI0027345B41